MHIASHNERRPISAKKSVFFFTDKAQEFVAELVLGNFRCIFFNNFPLNVSNLFLLLK